MKKIFLRIGATIEISEDEYEQIKSNRTRACNFIGQKVIRNQYKIYRETYAPMLDLLDKNFINDELNEPEVYIQDNLVLHCN